MTKITKPAWLVFFTLIVIGVVFLCIGPYPQWPEYHNFADDRDWLGLNNAQNVLSNVGLLLVGAWGALLVLGRPGRLVTGNLWVFYLVFFFGVFLTAFGSAYYHYDPDNLSLVWDRLPMTVMFMGFFTVAIGELVSQKAARILLLPLLITGFASVVYWIWTESVGAGDLRFYGLVQFLPALLIITMLFWYPKPPHFLSALFGLSLFFVLAKLFEHFDHEVYRMLNEVVGGHAIKHICAAIAAAFLVMMLYRRVREN